MDMVSKLNIVIYISLVFSLVASLLVVSPRPRIKLYGVLCYYVTNVALFVNYFITGAHSYFVTGLVFSTLSTINLIRVLCQMRRNVCPN